MKHMDGRLVGGLTISGGSLFDHATLVHCHGREIRLMGSIAYLFTYQSSSSSYAQANNATLGDSSENRPSPRCRRMCERSIPWCGVSCRLILILVKYVKSKVTARIKEANGSLGSRQAVDYLEVFLGESFGLEILLHVVFLNRLRHYRDASLNSPRDADLKE